jgi:hypothetical protein
MGTLTADCPRLDTHCDHKLATSCRLTSTPRCCACADERPHSRTYRVYIDGVGFVQRGNRWQSYCWFCKGVSALIALEHFVLHLEARTDTHNQNFGLTDSPLPTLRLIYLKPVSPRFRTRHPSSSGGLNSTKAIGSQRHRTAQSSALRYWVNRLEKLAQGFFLGH